MIGMHTRVTFYTPRVRKAVEQANVRSLGHAGAGIRLRARRSIKRGAKASQPGSPPHTRKGQLKTALLFAVERREARVVIGPTHERIGMSGMAHEFGGRYKRQRYKKRPFMGPALLAHLPKIPRHWAASVW